ncbi:permease prefix domain 1-containing protein [Sinosporangium siamense]|uniref:Uncharacterized protein n=1 Tax=Sinosporangium siamense TaxID=1367973 RepID=A0A919V6I9_9ACTN|nr:permease prefix domain 1-containing protein [Sinosporangium siamense]GII91037.1 hypothetical protein Ssi02_12680 [Sinosporangium siamense]
MRLWFRRLRDGEARGRRLPVDHYVSELERVLRGPSRMRADLVREVRDGLTDMADALEDDGLVRPEAERAAVLEFGTVAEVAPGLQRELSFAQGRRTGWLLFVVVALQMAAAEIAWRNDPLAVGPSVRLSEGYLCLADLMDKSQYVILALGLAAVAAFGPAGRWLPAGTGMVRAGGLFAIVAVVFKSIIAIHLVALVPGMMAQPLTLGGAAYQAAVFFLPVCFVMASGWRCLRVGGARLRTA